MNNRMINFGKYKGKYINEINDYDYLKYLSNYDYGMYCVTDLDNPEHDCDDDCQYKISVDDRHLRELDHIILNKESYVTYWNHVDENNKWSKEELINSKNNIWNELEQLEDIDKIRLIYNNQEYFDYGSLKWIHAQNKTFGTFYLVLNYPDIIQEVRKYLVDSKLCLYCGYKMPVIGSKIINGADHDDWETRMFHKKCFKEILINGC